MSNSAEHSKTRLRSIAGLFDDSERKEFFKKYLFFLGWVEVLILAVCWLYQLGDGSYDRFGPVEVSFPWKTYFLLSFLVPIGITFLIGVIIVGFNKYFIDSQGDESPDFATESACIPDEKSGRMYKIYRMVHLVQKLPFLALLILLAVGTIFFYKIDAFLTFVGNVGEKSVHYLLIGGLILLAVASLFALILVLLNYQLRKRAMDYEYRRDMADRFGLIILEDNTVLNSEGQLLINGKKFKSNVPLLPVITPSDKPSETQPKVSMSRPVDLEAS